MRNRNLYFITAILMFTITFIFPIKTNAKTYYANRSISSIIATEILEPGDIIDFSDSSSLSSPDRFYIYLEGQPVEDNCFGVENMCQTQFVVENRMIFHNTIRKSGVEYNVNFFKLKNDEEIKATINLYQQETPQEHIDKYFKSGDLIKLIFEFHGVATFYEIYDVNGNLLEKDGLGGTPIVIRLPKINDNDVYWVNTIVRGGVYNFPTSTFTPIEYTEPKIELKCDKDKINYGEKTKCEVYLESPYKMSNLNFSINHKNLKLSNISYLDGVTNSGNDNQIMKLSFDDNNSFIEKKAIMIFDVEGTKDSSYLDNISLENIEYTDEVLTAKYENLNSDLNIISTKPLTNPETGIRTLFIIMPILVLLVVGELSVIRRKEYEK